MIRDIGGPNCQKRVVQLQKFQRSDYGKLLWGHDEGMCGNASLVHEIDCLRGRTVVLTYARKLQELQTSICALSEMGETVRQLVFHLQVHVLA